MVPDCTSSTQMQKQEDCGFEGNLAYIARLKPYEETLPQKIDNKTKV